MRISVAICTYNGSAFLQAQLESIASQTREPDELVVCDDHSTDTSADIVQQFATAVSFPVRLTLNKENLGSTRNFEQAIRLCNGDIIALADQDDIWLPDKLQQLAEVFVSFPNVGLVFTDAEIVDEDLNATGKRLWTLLEFDRQKQDAIRNGRALKVLLPGWFVTGATSAFRSRFRELFLPLPLDLPVIHDGWIGAMVAAVADIEILSEPSILYRQHTQQQVGAPTTVRPPDKSLWAALERANPYPDQLAIAKRVLERLTGQTTFPVTTEVLKYLDGRILHLQTRAGLPRARLGRLRPVIGELVSGRYHRYSKGFQSAMKDLIS